MSDSLGDGVGNPSIQQARLYERWAESDVALSIIGEVQADLHLPKSRETWCLAHLPISRPAGPSALDLDGLQCDEFPRFTSLPPGGITAWFTMRLDTRGNDADDTYSATIVEAVDAYDSRDDARDGITHRAHSC